MHEDDANENFFNKFKSDFEEDLKSSKIFYQLLSVDNGAIKSLLLEKNIVIEKNGLRKNFIFGNGNKKGKYFKVHENGDEKNEVDHKEVEKIKIFSEEDIFNVLGIKFVEESERMTSM
ncbi:hypothetical protein HK099_007488 [Clydaea vesicula]|uniref:Uncharacterized protein n=1 Tax=Clydaea vesicula TaxID=447962 RepID=A0AAD5U917_9FUNG|nr:hypothetical protein HK099_007488 [Clydaea vesicula]